MKNKLNNDASTKPAVDPYYGMYVLIVGVSSTRGDASNKRAIKFAVVLPNQLQEFVSQQHSQYSDARFVCLCFAVPSGTPVDAVDDSTIHVHVPSLMHLWTQRTDPCTNVVKGLTGPGCGEKARALGIRLVKPDGELGCASRAQGSWWCLPRLFPRSSLSDAWPRLIQLVFDMCETVAKLPWKKFANQFPEQPILFTNNKPAQPDVIPEWFKALQHALQTLPAFAELHEDPLTKRKNREKKKNNPKTASDQSTRPRQQGKKKATDMQPTIRKRRVSKLPPSSASTSHLDSFVPLSIAPPEPSMAVDEASPAWNVSTPQPVADECCDEEVRSESAGYDNFIEPSFSDANALNDDDSQPPPLQQVDQNDGVFDPEYEEHKNLYSSAQGGELNLEFERMNNPHADSQSDSSYPLSSLHQSKDHEMILNQQLSIQTFCGGLDPYASIWALPHDY